jgi:hypothetical protein
MRRGSSVVIATAYVLDDREEFESRWGQEFSLLHIAQTGSGVHPASYPSVTIIVTNVNCLVGS